MPTNVIMPALELAQETGKVLHWLKSPGDTVTKGEPLVEIETDKITVEIEAPASGVLRDVSARAGDVVPVGKTIALIFAAGETGVASPPVGVKASPLARKIAQEHGVDIAQVKPTGGKIEKADVLAHVASRTESPTVNGKAAHLSAARLTAASPKARRLAAERGLDITTVRGSGPGDAVLAADVPAAAGAPRVAAAPVGNVWRIMAERMTASWTSAPHFYLVREVN